MSPLSFFSLSLLLALLLLLLLPRNLQDVYEVEVEKERERARAREERRGEEARTRPAIYLSPVAHGLWLSYTDAADTAILG